MYGHFHCNIALLRKLYGKVKIVNMLLLVSDKQICKDIRLKCSIEIMYSGGASKLLSESGMVLRGSSHETWYIGIQQI